MAKKSDKSTIFILMLISAGAAVLTAVFFFFLPLTTTKAFLTTLNWDFGKYWDITFTDFVDGIHKFKLILLVVITVAVVAVCAGKFFAPVKNRKLLSIISAAAFLLFIFVFIWYMSGQDSFLDFDKAFKNAGIGTIMAMIFAIVGLGSSVGELVLNK